LSIATTHFGELKALKYQDERFENASVEFNEESLSPTYRLLWGIPGRSNALTIARRLGLKAEVVDRAKTQLGGSTDDINQVIAGLEAQRRQQETKAAEAQDLLQQAERLHQQLSQKANQLQEREQTLRQQQEQSVQQAIAQAKGEIAKVIRRLQQGSTTGQEAQQATNALNQIAERHLPPSPKPKASFRPQVGDRIRIPRLGQTAEVLSDPDQDGELTVRFGMMKMTVGLEDIESLDGQKAEPLVKKNQVKSSREQGENLPLVPHPSPPIRTSENTIDLRGSRVADAESILERAIAQAEKPLWIIHGHGTGRLRQGIHSFLQQHPRVSHYQPAESAEGGTGVTVVYIK
jgi:DNA mismatch repair protein MutS2